VDFFIASTQGHKTFTPPLFAPPPPPRPLIVSPSPLFLWIAPAYSPLQSRRLLSFSASEKPEAHSLCLLFFLFLGNNELGLLSPPPSHRVCFLLLYSCMHNPPFLIFLPLLCSRLIAFLIFLFFFGSSPFLPAIPIVISHLFVSLRCTSLLPSPPVPDFAPHNPKFLFWYLPTPRLYPHFLIPLTPPFSLFCPTIVKLFAQQEILSLKSWYPTLYLWFWISFVSSHWTCRGPYRSVPLEDSPPRRPPPPPPP